MKDIFNNTTTLGEKIRKLRILKGLTQKELAIKANMSQSGIHKLEIGECMQTRKIVALSKALGVPPDELDTYDNYTIKVNNKNIEEFKLMKKMFPNWKSIILSFSHY